MRIKSRIFIPFLFFILLGKILYSQVKDYSAKVYLPFIENAPIVVDGVCKNSFCYRSRTGSVLYIYKFDIRNIYKGNNILNLGDVYVVQDGISGHTQDGSNIVIEVYDGNDPKDATGVNVLFTATVLTDTSKLPMKFSPLTKNSIVLVPQIIMNTRTSDQAGPNLFAGAMLGNTYFKNVDSLYSYLNYNLGFIPKKQFEAKVKNEPIKIEDKTIYGISQLTTHPHFPGGKDSLSSYVIANINRKLIPQSDIDSHRHMRFGFLVQTSADGDVEAVNFENGFSREFNEEFIRVIKSGPKFIPGLINGKPVKARITYFVDLKF